MGNPTSYLTGENRILAPACFPPEARLLTPAESKTAELQYHRYEMLIRLLMAACSVAGAAAVEVRIHPQDSLPYVRIPAGAFQMGCSPGDADCYAAEKPARQAVIPAAFWMGQTEVTVGAYKRFALRTGRALPPEPRFYDRLLNPEWTRLRQPMTMVNREDAMAYCAWVGGRLPSAVEWEYAARAGATGSRYANLDDIAWYANNSGKEPIDALQFAARKDLKGFFALLNRNNNGPHEVGEKLANAWGLHDTLGNVWEWVDDSQPLLKGGSWFDPSKLVRVSTSMQGEFAGRSSNVGFRCVLDAWPP